MRGIVVLVVLISGCAGPAAETRDPLPLPDAPDEAIAFSWQACTTWLGTMDAPADAFPAGPHGSVPGTLPQTVRAVLAGADCPGHRDLMVAFAVAGNESLLVARWWIENATHAAMLRDLGFPATQDDLRIYYTSQQGAYYSDGPGDEAGDHTFYVSGLKQSGAAPASSLRLLGNATILERNASSAPTSWSGQAGYGTTSVLEADEWPGTGSRAEGVTLSLAD